MIALGVATAATISGLWLVTSSLSALETQQALSRAELARAEAMRLALWRMDAWMTPRLAREAARPVAEYAAFFAPSDTVNRLLQAVPQGEVLAPSPLLLSAPEWIPIHFEWTSDGRLTSPQIPEGNFLDLAEGQYFADGVPTQRAEQLKRLAVLLENSKQSLDACVSQAEASNASTATAWSTAEPTKVERSARAFDDYATRAQTSNEAQQAEPKLAASRSGKRQQVSPQVDGALGGGMKGAALEVPAQQLDPDDMVGPLVPAWLSVDPPELAFLRRVRVGTESRVQGFLVDWVLLSNSLLGQITDLTSAARLAPVSDTSAQFAPSRLASLPAALEAEFALAVSSDAQPSNTPAILFAWAAALMALGAAALAAWTGVSFGDRQARFASSVTHELRTPLTTFQLYAEMLRDGMVTDEARRKECLDTLCRESLRLSALVENVLSLSRLERGTRGATHANEIDIADLRAIVLKLFAERAEGADCELRIDIDLLRVMIDTSAFSQILANLIENAAKYGHHADRRAQILVQVQRSGDAIVVRVSDSGEGISAARAASIWRPFDRAGREGGTQFGLGLGLSVSRALSENMGASLQLVESAANTGATFELRIPNALRF